MPPKHVKTFEVRVWGCGHVCVNTPKHQPWSWPHIVTKSPVIRCCRCDPPAEGGHKWVWSGCR